MNKIITIATMLLFVACQVSASINIKWKTKITNTQYSYNIQSIPAISDQGSIYIVTSGGELCCLNQNGTIKWTRKFNSFNESSVSISREGQIYFGNTFPDPNYGLFCYNTDGDRKWFFPTFNKVKAAPAISQDGTLFFGDESGYLYAVHSNGELFWKKYLGGDILEQSSIGKDGTMYVSSGLSLYAITYYGEIKWETRLFDRLYGNAVSAPAIDDDGTIYLCESNALYAINSDGTIKWSYNQFNQPTVSSPVIAKDGTIYVGTYFNDKSFYAFNPDGTVKWVYEVEGAICSSPALENNGKIYFTESASSSSGKSYLYCLLPNGTLDKRIEFAGHLCSPVISDGILFIGNNNGYLFAYYTGSYSSQSAIWPNSGGMPSRTGNKNYYDVTAPKSNFSTDVSSGYCPLTVKFNDESSGNIDSWLWTFEDSNVSTQKNPSYSFNDPGVYSISLSTSVGDKKDHTRKNNIITVYDPKKPMANFDFIGINKVGSSIQFKDFSISPKMTKWDWYVDNVLISNEQNPDYIFKEPGFYNVTLKATDINGVDIISKRISIYEIDYGTKSSSNILFGFSNKRYMYYQTGILCIDEQNKTEWSYRVDQTGFYPLMQADDSILYFGSTAKKFCALAPNGTLLWEKSLNTYVTKCPAQGGDGSIIACGHDGSVLSIKNDGTIIWQKKYANESYNAPVVDARGVIYLVSSSDKVNPIALNPDGSLKWQYSHKIGSKSPIAISPDGVYIASNDGYLHAIDENGQQKWAFESVNNSAYSPIVDKDGDIYFSSENVIYCIDSSGNMKWEYVYSHKFNFNIVIGRENVIFAQSNNFRIHCIDKSSGDNLYEAYFHLTSDMNFSPDGHIIGYYHTLKTNSKGLEQGGWPSIHFDTRNTGNISSVTPNFVLQPDSGMVPLEVQFWDNSSGNDLSFLWDFGDRNTSTLRNPKHIYAKPGVFTVSLTVSNIYKTATITKSDIVEVAEDVIAVNFDADKKIGFNPLTVKFQNKTTGSVDNWLWDFGDGNTSIDYNPIHTYAKYGTYDVKLTATDVYETKSLLKENFIKVDLTNDLSVRFSSINRNGDFPLEVSFVNYSSGTNLNYLWDFGDGTTSNEQNPVHVYNTPGKYDVSLKIWNDFYEQKKTWKEYVNVTDPNYIKAEFTYYSENEFSPVSIEFWDESDGNVSSWYWDFGDGTSSTIKGPSHHYSKPGRYNVTLTVSNGIKSSTVTHEISIFKKHDWFFESEESIDYLPVADKQNNLYLPTENTITKIDVNGNLIWTFDLDYSLITDIMLVDNNSLVGVNSNNMLFLIDIDGNLLWETELSQELIVSAMALSRDNYIILASYYDCITAFDINGGELWKVENEHIISKPVINSKNEIIIGTDNGELLIINEDGTIKNDIMIINDFTALFNITPLNDSIVYLITNYNEIVKANINTGMIWSNYIYDYIINDTNPVVDNNSNIFNYDGSSSLVSYDSIGNNRWSFGTYYDINSTASVDRNGDLYLTDEKHCYHLSNSGELIWEFSIPNGDEKFKYQPLILNDGTIILISCYGIYGIHSESYGLDNNYWSTQLYNLSNTSALIPDAKTEARFSANIKRAVLNSTMRFTDASLGDIEAWSWDFGDGNSSFEQNPIHSYNSAGSYTVSLKVKSDGVTDSVSYINYIVIEDASLTADFDTESTEGEAPLLIKFSNLSQGEISNYYWNWGDGHTSTEKEPYHSYDSPGYYTVTLIVYGLGTSDTIVKNNYIVASQPEISENITAHFDADIIDGEIPLLINFKNLSVGEIQTWFWDLGDGNTSSEKNPSHVYNDEGIYTVSLIAHGLYTSDTITVPDYINARQNVSVQDMTDSKISFYPNPIKNILYISGLTKDKETKIRVYNVNGQKMMDRSVISAGASLNFGDFKKGVYTIMLESDNTFTIKVIKE